MAEKIKVSRDVAIALNDLLSRNRKSYSFDYILGVQATTRDWSGEPWESLNKLSVSDMAKAIFIGYEIEETPEEKILARWNNVENILPERRFYYREGILDTLRLLGVKIKGINE